ncbi:T9SS type A sorting domain-containing protein [Aureispira sp. CCB-QB1]|uniref:T9SS type A sorting domain-containing protein n=1 Tax=Aureispira sp. CCB-QB1 TaxID=1313421 RepID=UPI0006975A10|nr:T9SS type A sorting domain-containing protein [Aureispira sp. CCB-QB1]
MKNMLTAVFLLGFLGISFGVFGQHLSVVESSRPCDINSRYTLYLEADPTACYGNSIQVTSAGWRAAPIDLGNGVGFAATVSTSVSPTGWAYAIEVQPTNRNRDIEVRELVYTPNCLHASYTTNITITPRVRLVPNLTDIEIVSSSLCVGAILAEAKDGNKTSASTYTWTFNGDPITSNAVQGFLDKPAGAAITSDFSIGVVAHNGCTARNYTKNFEIYPVFMNKVKINVPDGYCDGTKNEFSIASALPGIEYKWEFTANPYPGAAPLPASIATQGPYQALDKINFSPNFGKDPLINNYGLVGSYTITAWYRGSDCVWRLVGSETNNVDYSSCSGNGGSARTAMGDNLSIFNSAATLTAFPNPTTGLVELIREGGQIEAVKVYDIAGALVAQKLNITDSNTSIDLGKFPKGLYMVNIQTATTNETIRVVKE